MIMPFKSNSSRSSGMAVISFDSCGGFNTRRSSAAICAVLTGIKADCNHLIRTTPPMLYIEVFSSVFTCPKHTPSECALSRYNMDCFMRRFILVCRCIFRSPDGFPVNCHYFVFCNLCSECLACIVYEYFFQLFCVNPCKHPQNCVATRYTVFQFQIFFKDTLPIN